MWKWFIWRFYLFFIHMFKYLHGNNKTCIKVTVLTGPWDTTWHAENDILLNLTVSFQLNAGRSVKWWRNGNDGAGGGRWSPCGTWAQLSWMMALGVMFVHLPSLSSDMPFSFLTQTLLSCAGLIGRLHLHVGVQKTAGLHLISDQPCIPVCMRQGWVTSDRFHWLAAAFHRHIERSVDLATFPCETRDVWRWKTVPENALLYWHLFIFAVMDGVIYWMCVKVTGNKCRRLK